MPVFDLDNLTMNPEEATQVSQAVFERTITGGMLSEHHDIVTGIEHKTQIPFIGNLGLVGKKVTSCDRGNNPAQIPLTEKFWDPVLIGDRLKHCAVDVPSLFKLFRKAQRINPDFYDRIGSEELGVLVAKLEQAIQKMLNRLAWFGNTAADNVTDGGVITDGVDVAYFNIIDGLFKQIFTEIPTSASNYVEIAKNAGANYAAQTLDDGDAIAIFRAMHKAIDSRFFEAIEEGAQPEFEVTRELWQNYEDTLEDKSIVFSLAETQDGISKRAYRGIPIKVRHDWDNNIRSYEDNGTKYNLPNRAILTVKENIPIGTLSESDFDTLESWYEKKDKANYIDFDLKLDAKHLLPYMTVAAY